MSDIPEMNDPVDTIADTDVNIDTAIALRIRITYVGGLPKQLEGEFKHGSSSKPEFSKPRHGKTTCRKAIRLLDTILRTAPNREFAVSNFNVEQEYDSTDGDEMKGWLPKWFREDREFNGSITSAKKQENWRACTHEGCVVGGVPGRSSCLLLIMLCLEADDRGIDRAEVYDGDVG